MGTLVQAVSVDGVPVAAVRTGGRRHVVSAWRLSPSEPLSFSVVASLRLRLVVLPTVCWATALDTAAWGRGRTVEWC